MTDPEDPNTYDPDPAWADDDWDCSDEWHYSLTRPANRCPGCGDEA